jgi:hypothetical protein
MMPHTPYYCFLQHCCNCPGPAMQLPCKPQGEHFAWITTNFILLPTARVS